MAARLAVVEEELNETAADLEESISCLRYGLMESASGFVRFSTLSREQRSHMLVQERGNFTIWSLRNTADTTDPVHVPEQYRDDGEFFFRPTPCGFRQVVQQLSKPVANDINYLIRTGANAVVAAKVNWKRTDT